MSETRQRRFAMAFAKRRRCCKSHYYHCDLGGYSLEQWLAAAEKGGHTEKLRQLLEQLHVAVSRQFRLPGVWERGCLAAPANLYVSERHGPTHRVLSLRAIPKSCLSQTAYKLTTHEDARVAKAATAVCDYWRTLSSAIPRVPRPPPPPAPQALAPVSNLRPKFLAKFPTELLVLVLNSMAPPPQQQPMNMISLGYHRDHLDRRVRDIARVKLVCRDFRDAARLVLTPKKEADAVKAAKRAWVEKRVAEAKAKMHAERWQKEEAAWVIRYVEQSAKRKAEPEALTEAKACPEVARLRRQLRKYKLNKGQEKVKLRAEVEAKARAAEAKARDEAKKPCSAHHWPVEGDLYSHRAYWMQLGWPMWRPMFSGHARITATWW